ncbi:MAG: PEP-CTERM sorting domain-containing protein [Microcystaceae cyanobacterium]
MKVIQEILQKRQIQLTLLVITLEMLGGKQQAFASTLTPDTIINTWTVDSEVVYGLTQFGNRPNSSSDIWGVDNSQEKAPFEAITNHKIRIGRSSDSDTEQYGSLVSDFDLLGDFTFSGSFFMPNDNDIVGLLFGYQDRDNHYRLSWGSSRAKRGFYPDGNHLPQGPYERFDLSAPEVGVDEIGSGGMILLKEENGTSTFFENTFDYNLRWQTDVLYDFSIRRISDDLFIDIAEGENSVFSTMITDTTFMSGKVGFNTAGVEVFYGNIIAQENNTQILPTTVPEPLTILGSVSALAFGTFFKRKLGKTNVDS